MRIEIKPSARSTAEAPLWSWRIWDGGRSLAFGVAASREEASEQAEREMQKHQGRQGFNLMEGFGL